MGRGSDSLPNIAGACDNPRSRLGARLFPGQSHERSISSRPVALSLFASSVSHRPAVQSPAFERIDIAPSQRAYVSKVELEGIVAVVQWWVGMATGTNPHGSTHGERVQRVQEKGGGAAVTIIVVGG